MPFDAMGNLLITWDRVGRGHCSECGRILAFLGSDNTNPVETEHDCAREREED